MDLFTWTTRSTSFSSDVDRVHTYVLAGPLYGVASHLGSGSSPIGRFFDGHTTEKARSLAVRETEEDELNGYTVGEVTTAHFPGYDISEWRDVDARAVTAADLAEFIFALQRRILTAAGGGISAGGGLLYGSRARIVPGVDTSFTGLPVVGVQGPQGPPGPVPAGATPFFDKDGKLPSVTIEMKIDDIDPEVLKILTGGTIDAVSLGLTDGDAA